MKFIKGMDLSTLLELERLGAVYYDNGEEMDILDIMKRYDVDTIRLRIWNHPWSETGESYGAGENDVPTTLAIAKKVTEAGLGVLLNFHYSDFWGDPGKQFKPKAWAEYGVEELEKAVYDFTLETMEKFLAENVKVTMVQVGNELSNGLLWPEGKVPNYDNIATFVNAGIRAVRKANAEIPIMIHLDNGGTNALYREWFDALGLASAGSGVSTIFAPKIINGIIQEHGMQTAFLTEAGFSLIMTALVWLLVQSFGKHIRSL